MNPPALHVTVAVCTHNRAALLRGMLAGATRQDYPRASLEILVIDNNSNDDTAAVVASFSDAPHPPRRVVEPTPGLIAARERAIATAKGDLILFGDDDILVEPDWVRRMATPFVSDAAWRIGCAGGEVVPVFPDGRPEWIADWHAPLSLRADSGPIPPPQMPMGANLAVPRRVLLDHGGFRAPVARESTRLFGGEETDLVRRLRASGLEIWFVPEARVQHRLPAARTTFRHAARHAFDSARSRVIHRKQEGAALGYLMSRLVGNALKAAGFTLVALLDLIVLRRDPAKKALVRAWRACGYLYQIPRSLVGKI